MPQAPRRDAIGRIETNEFRHPGQHSRFTLIHLNYVHCRTEQLPTRYIGVSALALLRGKIDEQALRAIARTSTLCAPRAQPHSRRLKQHEQAATLTETFAKRSKRTLRAT